MFLPALIFEGAMETDYFIFQHQFCGGVMLAGPGMILQILLIALWAMYIFPYGWGFTESILFGSILSATDPVAVIGLMKELALLSDLRVLIEAESLMNDGTAIVVFELCIMMLLEPGSILMYVSTAMQLIFGAPALGLALFIVMRLWLQKTGDAIQDTMITVITAYLCYYLAEAGGCNVSGVLAVLTLGILMSGFGVTAIQTDEARQMLHSFWTLLCWISDTIIFVLAGVIIVQDGFLKHSDVFKAADWGYLVALYMGLIAIRCVMILVCSPVLRYTGYGMQPRVCSRERFIKYMCILSWGGLRGAVGLLLAEVVSMDSELANAVGDPYYCTRVLCYVAGIVVLTTIVNATSLEYLIVFFGLAECTETEIQIQKRSASFLVHKNEACITQFQNQHNFPDLSSVDWESVGSFVGFQALLPHNLAQQLLMQGGEKIIEEEIADNLETSKEMKMALYFRGRYLTALRCSYASQSKIGLLSGLAYRQLSWAIDTALDHCNDDPDLAVQFAAKHQNFEWGWLVEEEFLLVPKLLTRIEHFLSISAVKRVVQHGYLYRISQYFVRRQHARRMELLLGVARAHTETLRAESELYGDRIPDCAQNLTVESMKIKIMAENMYADLRCQMPDIASAVQTRQTCQLVLNDFNDHIESLHNLTQLTDKEFEHIRKRIFKRKKRLMYHLPPTNQEQLDRNLSPDEEKYNRIFSKKSLTRLFSPLFSDENIEALRKHWTIETFGKGQTVLLANCLADSIYIVATGMVRLGPARSSEDHLCRGTHYNMSPAASQLTLSHTNSPEDTPEILFAGNSSEDCAGEIHQGSLEAVEDACVNAMMLGNGCFINDLELLLDDAGFRSRSLSKVVAVTDVKLIRIAFKDLRLHLPAYNDVVQALWRNAGKLLCTRYVELFDYLLPPPEFTWPTTRLVCFEAGSQLVLRGPCLLVQGTLQREATGEVVSKEGRRKGSRSSGTQHRNTTGIVVESFRYLGLTDIQGFLFTVNAPFCKILLCESASCDVLDIEATTVGHFSDPLVDSPIKNPPTNKVPSRSSRCTHPDPAALSPPHASCPARECQANGQIAGLDSASSWSSSFPDTGSFLRGGRRRIYSQETHRFSDERDLANQVHPQNSSQPSLIYIGRRFRK